MKTFTIFFLIILYSFALSNCRSNKIASKNYLSKSIPVPESTLLAEVIMHLQIDYVNPEKLKPKKLLQGALIEIGRTIPEVWIFPKFDKNGFQTNLEVNFENETSILKAGKLNDLYDLYITLQKLIKHILERNTRLNRLKIEQLFARGILNHLDAYSVLLSNDIFHEFNVNIGGQFAGVGLVVGTRNGQLTVIAPMDGSPAAKAGMRPFDRIVAVDDEKTLYLTLDEILYRLRGEIGTPVTLSVIRKGHSKSLKFKLVREEIKLESVETFNLKSDSQNLRYIRVKNFQIGTSRELKNKLGGLTDTKGLILDLRNNPGGLLEEAVRVSDIFLSGKLRIVSTKGPSVSSIHDSKQLFAGNILERIPLVILINRGSASASEIVAAALKHHKRAIIIGEKSFGKGTVQSLWDLNDGTGLKLTIGEYLTPSGKSIHNIGVIPGLKLIPVMVPPVKNLNGSSEKNRSIMNQERFHLINEENIDNFKSDSDSFVIRYLSSKSDVFDEAKLILDEEIVEKLNSDIFIKSAKQVLLTWNAKEINYNLEQISREFDQKESDKISKALSEHGIDWSLNRLLNKTLSENMILNGFVVETSKDQVQLKVKLRNIGRIAGQRLLVITKSNNILLDGLEFPFGLLGPDQETVKILNLNFFEDMMEENESLELLLFDHNLKKLKTERLQLNFKPKRVPSFRFTMKMYDNGEQSSQGNGDGKVQFGEIISLAFTLVNEGREPVPELLLKIRGLEGSFRINRGRLIHENIRPNHMKKDYFLFKALQDKGGLGKINLEIIDTKSGSPAIAYIWDLENPPLNKTISTPIFSGLQWQDLEGNRLHGETHLESIMLIGTVSNLEDVRDVFILLNDKKVFYSSKSKSYSDSKDSAEDENEFIFRALIKLVPGKNNISVFSRNRYGFTSEKRTTILLVK